MFINIYYSRKDCFKISEKDFSKLLLNIELKNINVLNNMNTLTHTIKNELLIHCHNNVFYKITKILSFNFSRSYVHNKADFSVSKHLQSKIKTCGPITIAEFMKEALTNPLGGYYMKQNVFGKTGDFITSPEISPLFGEMIGVWIFSEWRKITKEDFQLVELGPGRGSLIKEVLKIFKRFKALDKLSLHLVEVSPALVDIQVEQLGVTLKETQIVNDPNGKPSSLHYKEGITTDGTKVFWYHAVEDVPKKFSIFLAHEFFDALPIHKYQKIDNLWREVFIDIDPKDDNKFRYVISSFPTLTSKLFITENEQRNHVEISPQTLITIDYLAQFLKENGGIMLIIDYGHTGDKMDTFRAFKNHQQQDPLVNPGSTDLTADVDFSMIKKIATKDDRTIVFGPTTQRKFLLQLGIDVRLKMLDKLTDAQRNQLTSEYHMLIDKDKMGECFKAMALFPPVLKQHLTMWPVAGFYEEKNQKVNGNKNEGE